MRVAFAICCTAVLFLGNAGTVSHRAGTPDRRVVDIVTVGDDKSERDHDYAGDGVVEGVVQGRHFRQAHGWLRYSLATYDDTEVTLRCTFRGSEGRPMAFDLLVEGRSVPTAAFLSPSASPATVDLVVPFAMTKGKRVICVTIRAVNGPTPGLIALQTVQEHLERPAW